MSVGTVVTFYSYKGGVGRSFALSNIAVLLARWGFKVLCIDWDLEAPGLGDFFGSVDQLDADDRTWVESGPGLVELITEFKKNKQMPLHWREYVWRLMDYRLTNLSLMKAGEINQGYTKRLHKLSWAGLYRAGFGSALEEMFEELRREYDFVLIDARTGVTDFSGIITAQLPDILVFLFTANEQSFRGSTDIARRARAARNDLPVDRARLLLFPLPARFETQLEHAISNEWRARFVEQLAEFYQPWVADGASLARLVPATTIPYVPFWSFGERLSAVEESSSDPLGINYSLENIAALLAHRLGETRLLVESRDEFVSSARRLSRARGGLSRSVFLSYPHTERPVAYALSDALARRGIGVFLDQSALSGRADIEAMIRRGIEQSEHMVVLVSSRSRNRKWQDYEIRTFLRQAAADRGGRLLIPFALEGTKTTDIPEILRQHRSYELDDDVEAAADRVLELVVSAGSSASEDLA